MGKKNIKVNKMNKNLRYFLWTILGIFLMIGSVFATTIISDTSINTTGDLDVGGDLDVDFGNTVTFGNNSGKFQIGVDDPTGMWFGMWKSGFTGSYIFQSYVNGWWGVNDKVGDFIIENENTGGRTIIKQGTNDIEVDPHIIITNTSIEIMPKAGSNIELNGSTSVTGNLTVIGDINITGINGSLKTRDIGNAYELSLITSNVASYLIFSNNSGNPFIGDFYSYMAFDPTGSYAGFSFPSTFFASGQNMGGYIFVDDNDFLPVLAIKTNTGQIGINTDTPNNTLSIDGSGMLQLEANTTAMICDASNRGAIYYDGTLSKHRGCNATSWNDLY